MLPHTAAPDHWSIFNDGAPPDLIAAPETVFLGPKGVGHVVTVNYDVVELPEPAVFLHSRHGIVDVELSFDQLWLLAELALLIQLNTVYDLVFLR